MYRPASHDPRRCRAGTACFANASPTPMSFPGAAPYVPPHCSRNMTMNDLTTTPSIDQFPTAPVHLAHALALLSTSTSVPSTTPTATPTTIPAHGCSGSYGIVDPSHLAAGDRGCVRQKWPGRHVLFLYRPAVVLAVLKDVALVEYECTNGTTALAFVVALRAGPDTPWERLPIRPCSYQLLLKPWLVAVIHQSGRWKGRTKRQGTDIPTPREMLKTRFVLKKAM